ncbi:polysaccharide lyase [Flavobacterium reichenbachii]|uniref:Polysaccharide lyase n=1 Tax=Flavobacterium reichenbachii TaxID=362418 RepID=A0A085ZGF8_9FLAO|nr:polysaccharide lyase [Flavobacterium reichenbachii]KFF03522.1 polysaccharide lyase [Flavobacterium reichenbachii]OXB15658.1 polysaccharide lyase [Flavobacterium reichenbachii]
MQTIFPITTFKRTLTILSFCSFFSSAYAQYPQIPKPLQEKADALLADEEKRLSEIWTSNYNIIQAEAKLGRPYLPWASYPKDFVHADIPAFPGAEGGGAFTPGGRGGRIFVVTSLEDSGKGTFREACEAVGARTIVFNVSGIIQLKKRISMRAPYVTIAGQTAPGDGICIAGETLEIDTHDVIIRHVRFRRGATEVTRRDDALGGNPIGNIIVDHCSVSWGLDENISLYRHQFQANDKSKLEKLPACNITIQNTISSEGLDTYNHAFGSTIGGLNSTFMRNLWADNISRNASIGMYGDFNFVNNVIFNWWNRSLDGGDYRSMFNIINNYFKPGPITPTDQPIRYRILKPEAGYMVPRTYGRAYVAGNFIQGSPEVTADNWNGGVQLEDLPEAETKSYLELIKQPKPFSMPQITIMSAEEAYEFVLNNVGATLPKRDIVDERIIKQVRTGKIEVKDGLENNIGKEYIKRRLPADSYKKGIITHPDQVGGYPAYKGKPYKDSDNDGIPDAWEKKFGLNPNDASDANKDSNGDGYTNIEKYFNGVDPKSKTDWTKNENNTDTLSKLKGLLQ